MKILLKLFAFSNMNQYKHKIIYTTFLTVVIVMAIGALPYSPFQTMVFAFDDLQFLNFLAWVVPFDFILASTTTWIVAMTNYYSFKFIIKRLSLLR